MFFLKFFYFLQGYVIIEVEGSSLERFISICIRRNIRLLDMDRNVNNRILCVVSNRDFKKMIHIVRKTKTRIRIVEKHGLIRLVRRLKNRMFFLAGAAAVPIFIVVMSQFIWSVSINGAPEDESIRIKEYLSSIGIREGALAASVPKASDVKYLILNEFKNVSWAWMYREGSKIRVEVRTGISPPKMNDKSKPCDIVASRSGIIEEIIVERGKGIVKKNEAVGEGDVLVAGTVDINDGSGYFTVHAEGSVRAKTSHTASGEFPMYKKYTVPGGNMISRYTVKLFGLEIPLYFRNEIPYESYTRENILREARIGERYYIGIGIMKSIYREADIIKIDMPYDTAVAAARDALEERISGELPAGSVLEESRIYSEQRGENVYVMLTMNFTEDIGVEKEFN